MALPSHSAPLHGDSNSNLETGLGPKSFVKERQALQSLLGSGEFHRSPNLEKILNYLCAQFFLGRGNQVKEYTVATEALDRREDFDPKRDSIVRVEMHRLRRRLKEYYAGRGADDLVRITIPDKSYVPEFVSAQPGIALKDAAVEVAVIPALAAESSWIEVRRPSVAKTPALLVAGLVLLLFAGIYWSQRRKAEVADAPAATVTGTSPLASAANRACPLGQATAANLGFWPATPRDDIPTATASFGRAMISLRAARPWPSRARCGLEAWMLTCSPTCAKVISPMRSPSTPASTK